MKTFYGNLWTILKQYRVRFIKAFLTVLLSNLLLVANPLVLRQALTSLDLSSGPATPNAFMEMIHHLFGAHPGVMQWALILFVITTFSAYFKYGMRMAFISISREVESDIREKLFSRIQNQSRVFFDTHGIGELLSRLTNDISAYRDLLGPGLMYPLFFVTLVIPSLIALFTISTPLAALAMAPVALIPVLHRFVRNYIYRLSLETQAVLGTMSNMTQEHYSGIRVVKSYAVETFFRHNFERLCRQFTTLNFKLSCAQGVLLPMITLLTKVTTVLLLLLSGFLVLREWSELSRADFISFMWIQSYVFFPLLMLGWVLPVYERGRAAYARLVEIAEEPIEVKDNPRSTLAVPPSARIEFRNLSFTYPGASQPSLSNINLSIEGNSFVGITGPLGAGKTTLIHLLNREYEIPHGMLFIAGREIHEYSLAALRSAMVTVEQLSFLFSRSVADNVLFGKQKASFDDLEIVARHADLHESVMEFPDKYETIVGERGMTLSGGQKQRVSLARAFLVNRPILLLDDIFSAVDTSTEQRIFKSIQNHFKGHTVLLITHRVSILDQMNRVIYMLNGSICEDGPPEVLKQQRGHYAALAEFQSFKTNYL